LLINLIKKNEMGENIKPAKPPKDKIKRLLKEKQ
jgi:hypothetical protein